MDAREPALIGGRYEVGELLGRGGMAEVRKGQDTRLGRVVAIKRLRTDLATDSSFQARFRREAQSSAALNHPAIVAVYDTGEEPAADGSGVMQPYIVMEYVAGRTLRDILREGRKILPQRALEITSDILSALDYSHRAGIIHRDIKPANVMLTPSGDVKVMDFGIARAMSDAAQTMTQTAAVVGTAQYLSPEQARGETVDSRSDVYSAGCVLYELLTGRPPFVGDSPVSVAYQHVREQAQPPSAHDPTLPPAIDTIVMKALAKRVSDRYQSAAAMRNDIERFLAGRPVQATLTPVAPPPPVDQTAIAPAPASALFVEDDTDRSHMRLLLALGAAVIVLIAIAALLLPKVFSGGSDQVPVPDVAGETLDAARTDIGKANLEAKVDSYQASDTVPEGSVISQDPPGGVGQYADPGTVIHLVVSNGKPEVQLPNVVGATYSSALQQLEELGLNVKRQPADSDKPKGQVLSQYPAAEEMVASGTTVTLEVARGPKQVPDVVGMTQADAEAAIQEAGFVPRVTPDTASTEPYGTVTSQSPEPPDTQLQGRDVVIWVSQYQGPPADCPSFNPDGTPADPSTCAPTETPTP